MLLDLEAGSVATGTRSFRQYYCEQIQSSCDEETRLAGAVQVSRPCRAGVGGGSLSL